MDLLILLTTRLYGVELRNRKNVQAQWRKQSLSSPVTRLPTSSMKKGAFLVSLYTSYLLSLSHAHSALLLLQKDHSSQQKCHRPAVNRTVFARTAFAYGILRSPSLSSKSTDYCALVHLRLARSREQCHDDVRVRHGTGGVSAWIWTNQKHSLR